MSWKESKVRLLPPPQAINAQDRKPDIQDLFLLASQATALQSRSNNVTHANPVIQSDTSNHQHQVPTLPLHPVKVESQPLVSPSSSSTLSLASSADSAMMPPPPPPPPPRLTESPGVSSTSGELEASNSHPPVLGKKP